MFKLFSFESKLISIWTCIFPNNWICSLVDTNFYHELIVKTVLPLAIALLIPPVTLLILFVVRRVRKLDRSTLFRDAMGIALRTVLLFALVVFTGKQSSFLIYLLFFDKGSIFSDFFIRFSFWYFYFLFFFQHCFYRSLFCNLPSVQLSSIWLQGILAVGSLARVWYTTTHVVHHLFCCNDACKCCF